MVQTLLPVLAEETNASFEEWCSSGSTVIDAVKGSEAADNMMCKAAHDLCDASKASVCISERIGPRVHDIAGDAVKIGGNGNEPYHLQRAWDSQEFCQIPLWMQLKACTLKALQQGCPCSGKALWSSEWKCCLYVDGSAKNAVQWEMLSILQMLQIIA